MAPRKQETNRILESKPLVKYYHRTDKVILKIWKYHSYCLAFVQAEWSGKSDVMTEDNNGNNGMNGNYVDDGE